MTQPHPLFETFGETSITMPLPAREPVPSGLLGTLATRLTTWHRRTKQARGFRGFDQRQLRDLGLNHFDQW